MQRRAACCRRMPPSSGRNGPKALGVRRFLLALILAGGSEVAPAVAQTAITFESLGAKADGRSDDGALITAGLLKQFGSLAQRQNRQRVEIHATAGKTYRLASPIILQQARVRLIGHGAVLACQGSEGIVISQGSSGNHNAEGAIEGFRFDDCATGIRATAATFWKISDNSFFANGTCIDFNGLSSTISGNYCRGQREELEGKPAARATTGIVVRSSRTFGAQVPSESFANLIQANRVYLTSGNCIALVDGGGHTLSGNDCEMNARGEVLINNAFGNVIENLYSEPTQGSPFVVRVTRSWLKDGTRQDAAIVGDASLFSLVRERQPEANRVSGGTFGGGADWDIDVQAGNFPIVQGVRYGTGNVRFAAGISGGYLLPGSGTPKVSNFTGGGLTDMSQPGRLTGTLVSSDAKPVNTAPGFTDFTASISTRRIDLAPPEADGAYQVQLTAAIVSGTPAPGALQAHLCELPKPNAFRICLAQPPGPGNVVRIQYRIVR